MEKIKLTKTEKQIIRELAKKPIHRGDEEKPIEYVTALFSLQKKGLADASILKEKKVLEAVLTPAGRIYYKGNPKLTNPIPLDRIIAIATLLIATLALFIGCIRLAAQVLH